MDQNKFKNLFQRYLEKNSNETESAIVNAWYRTYRSKESEILIDQEEKEIAKKALKQQLEKSITKTIKPYIYRIAAAITIVCTAGGLILNSKINSHQSSNEFTVLTTRVGQIKKITLPDHSIVWLNAASKMRLKSNFEGATREVFLDEGEAYFEVYKNPNKPFIVHSAKIRVQVLGTSFNVRSYQKLSTVKVSVSTGRVQVDHQLKTLAILKPKQQLTYNKLNNTFSRTENEEREAKGWTEGKIYLHQVSFKELQLVLENNFGIQIKPGKTEVSEYQFTLNLQSRMPKEQILKVISAIHNSSIRKEGNDLILY